MKTNKNNQLITNTIMMYILTFSTYFFSFITVPYQSRILKPEIFGVVSLSFAIVTYFQIVIEFGFNLSATKSISENINDYNQIKKIYTSVMSIKSILFLILSIIFWFLLNLVPSFAEYKSLYILTFFSLMIGSFLPDFVYRGIEKMSSMVLRTVLIKFIFTIMIFAFVKRPDDYLLIPLFTLSGNILAVIVAVLELKIKHKIEFVKINIKNIYYTFKESLPFFISRAAVSIYTITNSTIIGVIYPTGHAQIGYYTGVEKIINVGKNAASPVSDSLYPYMIKTKNYKLLKQIILILIPFVIVGAIIGIVFAEQIVVLILGNDYRDSYIYFRWFIPVLAIVPFSYILGFPALSPINKSKHANYSTYVGTIIQIAGISLLFLTGYLNIISLIILTGVSEFGVLLYRISILLFSNKKNTIEVNETNQYINEGEKL